MAAGENHMAEGDPVGSLFSRLFEKTEDEDQLCFVDAGLAFNSPYPLVLRSQRSIDLILSFDCTDRNSVNGDPFKEVRYAKRWADLHQVKFPPIPEFKENEQVKELYILEDENDPLCPVIMHFVLVNKDFKRFTKPGVPRTSEEEMDFGDFDLFEDKSCPYNSTNFQYNELQFERLAQLVQFNVRNNMEEIENQIKRCVDNKRICKLFPQKKV